MMLECLTKVFLGGVLDTTLRDVSRFVGIFMPGVTLKLVPKNMCIHYVCNRFYMYMCLKISVIQNSYSLSYTTYYHDLCTHENSSISDFQNLIGRERGLCRNERVSPIYCFLDCLRFLRALATIQRTSRPSLTFWRVANRRVQRRRSRSSDSHQD